MADNRVPETAADWIADMVDADRADASSAIPPVKATVSPHSLLYRVVVAEGGSAD